MSTNPTDRFPGDATAEEVRTAVDALRLFVRHDGLDDWKRVAEVARWIADAADWQAIPDAKTALPMNTRIPADLATWNPADVTAWLAGVADDETTTDAEYAAAQQAVAVALLGDSDARELA